MLNGLIRNSFTTLVNGKFKKRVINIDNYKKIEGMLYKYKKIKKEICNLELEVEFVKNNYEGCTGLSYEEKGTPTNKFSSVVENEVVTKERMLKELSKRIELKQLEIEKIDNALSILNDKKKELIRLRYIDGQGRVSWPQIARQMYISESRCYQLKDETINELIPMIFISNYSKTIGKL